MLGRQFPQVKDMLLKAADDITPFAAFPVAHWKKIWSTNPLESPSRICLWIRLTDGRAGRGSPGPHGHAVELPISRRRGRV